jgi:hypothetical protein
MMKNTKLLFIFLLATLVALSAISADAATKKKTKKKVKKTTQTATSPYVISIGYPSIVAAYNAIKARSDVTPKSNAKPFGWQQRGGNWYVANEPSDLKKPANFEWAFTEPGHYAHPSVVKRMIDIGSKDHVYLDMAFRCGAEVRANCDMLSNEFKEVNLLIRKVYQKKYIQTADGTPAWDGVDSLE